LLIDALELLLACRERLQHGRVEVAFGFVDDAADRLFV